MTIDENFKELEELLCRMETTSSLEQAFADYEQGMKLIKTCTKQINEIEQKVIALQTTNPEADKE